jgi:hypothetical protein
MSDFSSCFALHSGRANRRPGTYPLAGRVASGHSRSKNGVASLAHSRSKNGVASLAYSRSKNGVASLAYSRSKNGVASLAYGRSSNGCGGDFCRVEA